MENINIFGEGYITTYTDIIFFEEVSMT